MTGKALNDRKFELKQISNFSPFIMRITCLNKKKKQNDSLF